MLYLLQDTLLALLKIFLIYTTGFLCGTYPRQKPLLHQEMATKFSRLILDFFLPCFIFIRIGGNLTTEILKDYWPMLIWVIINLFVSYLVTQIAYLTIRPKFFYPLFLMCCIFSNPTGFPLLFLESLCENLNEFSNDSLCFDRAVMYIYFYYVLWNPIIFLFGLPYLSVWAKSIQNNINLNTKEENKNNNEKSNKEQVRKKESIKQRILIIIKTFFSRMHHATWIIFLSIGVGLYYPLQKFLFDGPLVPLTQALDSIGYPLILFVNVTISASLAHSIMSDKDDENKKLFFQSDSQMNNLHPPKSTIIMIIIVRLIIVPIIGFAICLLFKYFGNQYLNNKNNTLFYISSIIYPNDPVFRITVIIELAAPSANMIFLYLHRLGGTAGVIAEQIARVFFIQYIVLIFTALCIIVVSLQYLV